LLSDRFRLDAAIEQELGSERAFHLQNSKQEVVSFNVPLGEPLGLSPGLFQDLYAFGCERYFYGSRDAFAWRDVSLDFGPNVRHTAV
jgi:hypothetical protein